MKRFLKKRWLGLPVGIITVVLLVLALTGTALAANGYIFFEGKVDAEVREAIAVGCYDTWDNLHPYGSEELAVWEDTPIDGEHNTGTGELGDVTLSIMPAGDAYKLIIAALDPEGYDGSGFVAGEWIVIPINLRNGSSVALDLGANADVESGLVLECCWLTNEGTFTEQHPDGDLNYDFKALKGDSWVSLNGWTATIPGYGGHSGSARLDAQVLFVRITAPQDVTPGPYTEITFSLARGVV